MKFLKSTQQYYVDGANVCSASFNRVATGEGACKGNRSVIIGIRSCITIITPRAVVGQLRSNGLGSGRSLTLVVS